MANSQKEYVQLPGSGYRVISPFSFAFSSRTRCTLWQASDHFLFVESQRCIESYRRFYFTDLQAVIVRRTARGGLINIIGFLAVGLFALIAVASGIQEAGWLVFWTFMAAIPVGIMITNVIKGPTCICFFKTAVQTEEIPSLKRQKRVDKIIAIINRKLASEPSMPSGSGANPVSATPGGAEPAS
jgi:hypothetical protein